MAAVTQMMPLGGQPNDSLSTLRPTIAQRELRPEIQLGCIFLAACRFYDRYSVTSRGYFSDKLVDQRLGYSENMLLSFFF